MTKTNQLLLIEINFDLHQPEILFWLKNILNIITILKHNNLQDKNNIIVITTLIKT